MLLESIEEAIKKCDIRNGAVISGIGTLKSCHMHYITNTDFTIENKFFKIENQPMESVSLSGLIADGRPHLHAMVTLGEGVQSYGGHLEDQCEVMCLVEIAILVFDEHKMTRKLDPDRNLSFLAPKI